MSTTKIRLNKFLAQAGLSSRRGADALILAGQVRVNGQQVTQPGIQVEPGVDEVLCRGQRIEIAKDRFRYILLHKPVHIVCTTRDPQKRKTILDLLPPALQQQRIVPVGRLDYMSEGLLLLTNDGQLTWRLTHPKFEHPKEYKVWVRQAVGEKELYTMRQGMVLAEGEVLAPVQVRAYPLKNNQTLLRMVLIQGLNRQIRRMCRDLGLTILKLQRVAMGPIKLGNLAPGAWRELSIKEVQQLKSSVALPK